MKIIQFCLTDTVWLELFYELLATCSLRMHLTCQKISSRR